MHSSGKYGWSTESVVVMLVLIVAGIFALVGGAMWLVWWLVSHLAWV